MIRDAKPVVPGREPADAAKGRVAVRLTRRARLLDGEHLDVTVELELPCDQVNYPARLRDARESAAKELGAALQALQPSAQTVRQEEL
jgi:hypothetical protein